MYTPENLLNNRMCFKHTLIYTTHATNRKYVEKGQYNIMSKCIYVLVLTSCVYTAE